MSSALLTVSHHVCVCVCVCVHTSACVCAQACIYTCVNVCVYLHACMCVCVLVCVHVRVRERRGKQEGDTCPCYVCVQYFSIMSCCSSAAEDDVLSLDSFKQDSKCIEGHAWVMGH